MYIVNLVAIRNAQLNSPLPADVGEAARPVSRGDQETLSRGYANLCPGGVKGL